MSDETDYLGQYINYLLKTLDSCRFLREQGHPYRATMALKDVIYPLKPISALSDRAEMWLNGINTIQEKAFEYSRMGVTVFNRQSINSSIKDRLAGEVYDEIVPEIWGWIHDQGYINIPGSVPAKPSAGSNVSGSKPRKGIPSTLSSRVSQ